VQPCQAPAAVRKLGGTDPEAEGRGSKQRVNRDILFPAGRVAGGGVTGVVPGRRGGDRGRGLSEDFHVRAHTPTHTEAGRPTGGETEAGERRGERPGRKRGRFAGPGVAHRPRLAALAHGPGHGAAVPDVRRAGAGVGLLESCLSRRSLPVDRADHGVGAGRVVEALCRRWQPDPRVLPGAADGGRAGGSAGLRGSRLRGGGGQAVLPPPRHGLPAARAGDDRVRDRTGRAGRAAARSRSSWRATSSQSGSASPSRRYAR